MPDAIRHSRDLLGEVPVTDKRESEMGMQGETPGCGAGPTPVTGDREGRWGKTVSECSTTLRKSALE